MNYINCACTYGVSGIHVASGDKIQRTVLRQVGVWRLSLVCICWTATNTDKSEGRLTDDGTCWQDKEVSENDQLY